MGKTMWHHCVCIILFVANVLTFNVYILSCSKFNEEDGESLTFKNKLYSDGWWLFSAKVFKVKGILDGRGTCGAV